MTMVGTGKNPDDATYTTLTRVSSHALRPRFVTPTVIREAAVTLEEYQSWAAGQELANKLVRGMTALAADLRDQGIHVCVGTDPRCVTCGQRWPCRASYDTARAALYRPEEP